MKYFLLLASIIMASPLGNAQSIKATKYGSGNTLLLLPGFASSHHVFDHIIDTYKKDYEVIAIDYAGFAGLNPVSFPWLPKIQDDLKILVENQRKPVTIIGHSMGGTIALWLAAQPDLAIDKTIIIDALPATGALMFPDYQPENIIYDNPYNQQQLALDKLKFDNLAQMMASNMARDSVSQILINNGITASDRKTYVYGYTDYLKLDVRPLLSQIKAPVHILAAGRPYGKKQVVATIKKKYAFLGNYSLKIHPDSKHFIMYDEPVWLKKQLDKWL
ncbi:MAG: alpha/beta hydrolase [Nonlabens sp.]